MITKMKFQFYTVIFVATSLAGLCSLTEIRLGIILPEESSYPWSNKRVLPAIELAVEIVQRDVLPETRLVTYVKDSECSETMAPLAAMDLYTNKHVNVLFGPVCDYAVAPVAKFSPYWNVPVITAGAHVKAFDDKSEYKLLTRIHETYSGAAESFIALANTFNWTHFGLLYEDRKSSAGGKSKCFFRMEVIFTKIQETFHQTPWYHTFTEDSSSQTEFEDILRSASLNARIFVLCGSADSVRELMIKAHELGLDNGEYVFINIDLGGSENELEMPWYRDQETLERNNKARKAYETVMTISLRKQRDSEYSRFSNEVKRRAESLYENFHYNERLVNSYVGAFHDAVILYGLALNETIEAGEAVTDGKEVTRRMWNKTFHGITGNVAIDENGDQRMDYSLLDMEPSTGKFQVVMSYEGLTKVFVPVPGTSIHWGDDYGKAATDTLECGFDNLNCVTNDESTVTSKPKPSKQQIAIEMLEDLKTTLAQISKAVDEHNASLVEMTKFVKEGVTSDIDS